MPEGGVPPERMARPMAGVGRRILLLCGPSGGGKSTFIAQLKAGTLAPGIAAALPTGSGSWPIVEATNDLRAAVHAGRIKLADALATVDTGVIFHYDIVAVHRSGLAGYDDDPVLAILELADVLDIVYVRPGPARLHQQFVARTRGRIAGKSWPRRVWRRAVNGAAMGFEALSARVQRVREEQIYQDTEWINGCYRQWESYLERLLRPQDSNPLRQLVVVEPYEDANAAPAFRRIDLPARAT